MVFYLVMINRKGGCSMFGANATATPDGGLLQLRALDWNVDGRIKVLTHMHAHVTVVLCISVGSYSMPKKTNHSVYTLYIPYKYNAQPSHAVSVYNQRL